jgi:two-component system, sensor histidine kinase FlrB
MQSESFMTEPSQRLEAAFGAFNRLSEELATAYRDLEQRAAALAAELARSRQEKEHQRAQKERLADRLSTLIESLPGAVLVIDERGVVSECNATARLWLGEPLTGASWPDCAARAGADLGLANDELTMRDGRQLTVSSEVVEGGDETIILLTDVTEQRHLQARLDRNRRLTAMGEMAARLAHQVRTPLSSAMLYAAHLVERELPVEQRRQFGSRLIDRLRDLEHLTRDMLGYVRGGNGQTETLRADDVFEALGVALEGQLPEGCELSFDNRAGAACIQVDRQAVIGALCNLVENAWQAGGHGTRVTLLARHGGDASLHFEVHDNGPGMDAEQRARVLEPFYSTRPGGTGLGLPVVRAVAEAHRGELMVHSRPGQGSCFTLVMPRVSAPSAQLMPLVAAGGMS